MKSYGQLFEKVCQWENLLLAARRARLRKRCREDVLQFQYDLEYELISLQQSIMEGTYTPGEYRSFEISDPKRRLISAAPYRDRVVHHAICNIIEPIFERSFIADSYACRKGKGQVAALRRARYYVGKYPYCLKTDIRKYFPSIDHQLLISMIGRKVRDPRLISLLSRIIAHPYPGQLASTFFPGDDLISVAERTCGLPIGNQTSQLFGNLYLDGLDHLIKERMRVVGYVRYMDDLVLFGETKRQLWQWLDVLRDFAQSIRLRLHPKKTQIAPSSAGFRFLGFRVRQDGLTPFPENVVRFRRRLKALQELRDAHEIDLASIKQSVFSYWGFFQIAGSRSRFRNIVADFPFFEELVNWELQDVNTSPTR